ncbi:response regulator transcription factor [Caulobacter sp. BP25]|uniref:response regulator transcription factor n=1 Tax=Caulobacter sp. BP25 TaxID=2048900 RepID=UPI000C12CD90|nr:response regulator transcription factor [Caulobacter sp. BP25]PHY20143.1 DNA-binding response regulator [Caulobacter sp. BP25]
MHILVVEDDTRVADFLERGLKAEGYKVRVVRDGISGLEAARELDDMLKELDQSGVILLDLMLPKMTGVEVCQTLRASGIMTPILMLTALGAVEDRVTGLRTGADDYLVKPFSFEELLARIEALLRRPRDQRAPTNRRLKVGVIELDRTTMRVTRDGEEIILTARELALLELFLSAPGRVLSRERILSNVWGVDEDPLTNVVDVYVRRLRAKLDPLGAVSFITTVRGLGYRLEPTPQKAPIEA